MEGKPPEEKEKGLLGKLKDAQKKVDKWKKNRLKKKESLES